MILNKIIKMSNKGKTYRKKSIVNEDKGVDYKYGKSYNIVSLHSDYIRKKLNKQNGEPINKGDKKPLRTIDEFRKMLNFMNEKLVEEMSTKGLFLKIPYGLGTIKFIKYLITPEYIDYLYNKTNKKVYIPATKESKYRVKIKYDKRNGRTYKSQLYSFTPNKNFKSSIEKQMLSDVGHKIYFES